VRLYFRRIFTITAGRYLTTLTDPLYRMSTAPLVPSSDPQN